MRVPLVGLLALAAGLLLVPPPGWCGGVTGGRCCGRIPTTTPTSPARPAACPEADCGTGCCRGKIAVAPPPDAPAIAPAPKAPAEPARKAHCCERPPTDAPKQERLDLAALPVGVPNTPALVPAVTGVARRGVTPRAAWPPLHLLNCVWLC